MVIIVSMKRFFIDKLVAWKHQNGRKPLIVRGARQVGKTHSLKAFGASHFRQYHYINFEQYPELNALFTKDLNPRRIIEALNFHLNTEINIAYDLVIFDEIQASPHALTSLKYFCEELPELALCGAGSLLGIHLTPTSFPVGKVDLLTLYPMSFEEFLEALHDKKSVDFIHQCDKKTETFSIVHQHLFEKLKWYFIVGGLPEVVQLFVNNTTHLYNAFERVREKQHILIKTYNADMAKHAGKANAMHIDRVWKAVSQQLAQTQENGANRFQFKGIIPNIDRYSRLADVIDWLVAAELVIKVPVIKTPAIPLSPNTQTSSFKLFMFDIGLLGAHSGLAPKNILDYDYGSYKGYFAENYVAQALTCNGIESLYSWQENKSEVEFLFEYKGEILPVEVKSGQVTKAKSLQKFCEKYHPFCRVILSAKPLCIDEQHKIHHYPLYLVSKILL